MKSAVVLAKGDNLFQTLVLNLVHYSAEDGEPFRFKASADQPAWERDTPTGPAPHDLFVQQARLHAQLRAWSTVAAGAELAAV